MSALRQSDSALQNDDDAEPASKQNASAARDMRRLLRLILAQQLTPALVFSFSKKDCEMHALSVAKLDLATEQEKM